MILQRQLKIYIDKTDRDKTEWIHKKSLEFIKKGYDSDDAYIFAYRLYDKKEK
tara:strand:+ start:659 stop:817 length:159 start_codon:yes stop_codon:yes gene_type:complete